MKTKLILIFRDVFICNLQIIGIGKSKVVRSTAMLMKVEAKTRAPSLRICP